MVAADNTNGEAIGAEYTDKGYSETIISWNILANSLGLPAVGEVMDFFTIFGVRVKIIGFMR